MPPRLGPAAIAACSLRRPTAPPAAPGGSLHLHHLPGGTSASAGCARNCTRGESATAPRLGLGSCSVIGDAAGVGVLCALLYTLVKNWYCYSHSFAAESLNFKIIIFKAAGVYILHSKRGYRAFPSRQMSCKPRQGSSVPWLREYSMDHFQVPHGRTVRPHPL